MISSLENTIAFPVVAKAETAPDFSHLAKIGEYPGAAAVAKNVRAHLKKHFPGLKFSVTCSRGTGNSVRIGWTDGPTERTVEAVAKVFTSGSFDGKTDCYNYRSNDFTKTYGSVRYVFANREYSKETYGKAIEALFNKYSFPGEMPTVEDYKQGNTWNIRRTGDGENFQTLLHREMCPTAY